MCANGSWTLGLAVGTFRTSPAAGRPPAIWKLGRPVSNSHFDRETQDGRCLYPVDFCRSYGFELLNRHTSLLSLSKYTGGSHRVGDFSTEILRPAVESGPGNSCPSNRTSEDGCSRGKMGSDTPVTSPGQPGCPPAAGGRREVRIRSGGGEPCHVESLPAFFGVPEVILELLVEPTLRTRAKGDG